MQKEKGFIQIPLLLFIIVSITGAGFILYKNQKTLSNPTNTANISQTFQNSETFQKTEADVAIEEKQASELIEEEIIQEIINKNEIVQQEENLEIEKNLKIEDPIHKIEEVEIFDEQEINKQTEDPINRIKEIEIPVQQKADEQTEELFENLIQEQEKEQEEIKENPIQGYSKSNPASLLMPITVKGEHDSHIHKWKITLLEFIRGSQALANMQEEYKTQNQPQYAYDELKNVAPGYEYLLIKIKAECTQGFIFDETVISEPQCGGVGMRFGLGFTIIASDAKEFSSINQILYGLNLGQPSEEGSFSVDWLAFRIPIDDNLLLRYREMSNDGDFTNSIAWFQIY